jgi:small subunit ribosomal protein S16
MTGAQPSDTARAILSYEGVLYKKHLLGGVSKGAFDAAAADTKFEAWKQTKAIQVQDKRNNLSKGKKETLAQRLAAEQEVNKARLAAISQKAEEAAKATEPQAEENSEATTEEASAE